MSDNIIVTGFGPFRNHNINASWEAVKLLPDEFNGFSIIKKEIPVTYNYIENEVPRLWELFNPILIVHVGVSSLAHKLTIEKCAFRMGYNGCDCLGQHHPTKEVCTDGADYIVTGINVDKICEVLNTSRKIEACVSTNAGRYLCEFTYYTSLNIDKNKTLFVHVPPVNEPYSAAQLSQGLLTIISCALNEIKNK